MHQVNYEKYVRDEQFKPLTQYIKETPIMVNKAIVGSKRANLILTDEARLVIRAIIIELYFLHKMRKCPRHFDESNVFIRVDGIAQLRGCNLDDRNDFKVFENYQDAHKVIVVKVFQQHKKDIPKDVKHLLELMNNRDNVISMELEYLICTHASLVPLRNRETFFLWMYRHIKFMAPLPTWDIPYESYWYEKLKWNDLRMELFGCRKDVVKGTDGFPKSYRNALAHFMEKYVKGTRRYTAGDIQQILLITFPFFLPWMQEQLWQNKRLGDLQLDSLFGSNLDNEFGVSMDPPAVTNCNKSNIFSFQVGSRHISANQDMKKNGPVFQFRNMHHISYVENIQNLEFKPFVEYMHIQVMLVGPTCQRVRRLMSEEAKFVIRSLLKELYFLHRRGKCPRNFDESNVFIREDGAVQLRECYLEDKSDSMVSENYKDARNIIEKIVFKQKKEDIPEDVMHLLNLMNTDKVISMELEYLICIHASLVSLRNRETFFLWMYRHIMFVLKGDESTYKNDIINAWQKLDWGDKLHNFRPLKKYFKCEKYGSKEEIVDFFNSYRDIIFHGMDKCKANRKRYTPDDIQLILWATFPMLLPTMQQELWKKKQLRDLKLDGLFGSTLENVFNVTSCFIRKKIKWF
ncbi:uncharacterized protein LOC127762268 [Oryza glaberrima]|uniref:Uncharacterized protein n=1 Tax=Oryza barthii TaxID=65489 RepID=A0A0D3F424_9ORYZ|nr:uncharacterized protein LOC127762268 [Oryza glaberrima]